MIGPIVTGVAQAARDALKKIATGILYLLGVRSTSLTLYVRGNVDISGNTWPAQGASDSNNGTSRATALLTLGAAAIIAGPLVAAGVQVLIYLAAGGTGDAGFDAPDGSDGSDGTRSYSGDAGLILAGLDSGQASVRIICPPMISRAAPGCPFAVTASADLETSPTTLIYLAPSVSPAWTVDAYAGDFLRVTKSSYSTATKREIPEWPIDSNAANYVAIPTNLFSSRFNNTGMTADIVRPSVRIVNGDGSKRFSVFGLGSGSRMIGETDATVASAISQAPTISNCEIQGATFQGCRGLILEGCRFTSVNGFALITESCSVRLKQCVIQGSWLDLDCVDQVYPQFPDVDTNSADRACYPKVAAATDAATADPKVQIYGCDWAIPHGKGRYLTVPEAPSSRYIHKGCSISWNGPAAGVYSAAVDVALDVYGGKFFGNRDGWGRIKNTFDGNCTAVRAAFGGMIALNPDTWYVHGDLIDLQVDTHAGITWTDFKDAAKWNGIYHMAWKSASSFPTNVPGSCVVSSKSTVSPLTGYKGP